MRRIRFLAGLPVLGESARDDPSLCACEAGLPTPARFLPGPLTRLTLARLGEGEGAIVVEDFTKVFLGWEELRALLRSRPLAVLHAAAFGGFVVRLRDVGKAAFAAATADATSAAPDRGNTPRTSELRDGLRFSKISPDVASVHWPAM